MANQQLLDYIKLQLQRNVGKEKIYSDLEANGWQTQDIDDAFGAVELINQASTLRDQESKLQPQSSPTLSQISNNPLGIPDQSASKKSHKTTMLVVLIVAVVFLLGGGAYAYNYLQSPGRVVQKMVEKLTNIKSIEYAGEINLVADTKSTLDNDIGALQSNQAPTSAAANNYTLSFSGASDSNDQSNPKSMLSLTLSNNTTSSGAFSLGLESRVINKISYIKINSMTNSGLFDLSSVNNKWIKIDAESIKKQFGSAAVDQQVSKTENYLGLSNDQTKKIYDAVQNDKVFKISEKLPNETLNDVETYHYKFTIDKTQMKKLFSDINQIVQGKALSEAELSSMDKELETIKSFDGEIWIGKNDSMPYKISLNISIDKVGSANIVISLNNFDKPVNISVPSQTQSLEQVLNNLMSSLQKIVPMGTIPSQ